MESLEKAIERIKVLECPSGNIEDRVKKILEEYLTQEQYSINIEKDEDSKNRLETYMVVVSGDSENKIKILAKSGLDDYVTTVVDVFVI